MTTAASPARGVVVSDPLTLEMLARYRAMPPAAKSAFILMMKACMEKVAIYPVALRFMQAMGMPDAAERAARFAADMHATERRRKAKLPFPLPWPPPLPPPPPRK